jgi:hypothetical protein
MVVKCHCQQCNGPIGFQAETLEEAALRDGETRICFRCGKETRLNLPAGRLQGLTVEPSGNQTDRVIALIYCGAVFMPINGFFGGIYLMAKKEPGHGACAMAVSILCGFTWFWLLVSMSHQR